MAKKPTYEELEQRIKELEKAESEQKRIEKSLRKDLIHFQLLYERAPLGYQSLDKNGNFIAVNQAWLDILGYSREEVIGKSFGEFLHPAYKDHFKENFSCFKADGEILGVEFEMVKKDDSSILVSFNGGVGKAKNGGFQQTHCIFQEVTEQKRMEEALRKSKEKLKDFINSAPTSFIVSDSEFNIIQMNRTYMETFHPEMDPEDLIGKNLLEIVPNLKKKKGRLDEFMKVVETGTPFCYDDFASHPKVGDRYIAVKAFKMADGLGTIIVDITDRKQTERTLKESEEWHRNFLDRLNDCVFEADNSGNITYANKIAESIAGVPLKDIIGKPFLPLFDKKSQKIAVDVYHRTLNGESPEYELTFNNGNIAYFKNKPLKNNEGKVIGVFGVAMDVTNLKAAEESLKTANARLEKTVKRRTAELKNKNIALNVLLNQFKNDKKKMEKTIMSNIRKLVIPCLKRIERNALNGKQKSELDLLEANLNTITSPFEVHLSPDYLTLTPTEMQVINFIKHNATSKEIAQSLGISPKTIDTHRQNIRKKIGIRGKGINLKTYLESLT